MDNLNSIVATELVDVYTQTLGINYYTVHITAGVEKLATETATPRASEGVAATTTSMAPSTTSNLAAQKTQNVVLAGAAAAVGAFIL